jgi:hypothetical protein
MGIIAIQVCSAISSGSWLHTLLSCQKWLTRRMRRLQDSDDLDALDARLGYTARPNWKELSFQLVHALTAQ